VPIKYDVIILPSVERQIEEITSYIAKENLTAAKAFIVKFESQVESLEGVPLRGALIPENKAWGTAYRELFNGEYRTIFRVSERMVIIVGVVHGAR
jgi:plasmid stabilization system protein ParE